MKTQFVVTVHQSGDVGLSPATLERGVLAALRSEYNGDDTKVTVRHVTEEQPEAAPAAADRTALAAMLRDAHRAGQKAGHMIGKDGADAAIAYAERAMP